MRAFVLKGPGQAGFIEVEEPHLESEYSAILEPVAVSVCTSDVNTVYGTGSKKPDDLVLGHECVARVVEIGARVRDFQVGDIVAVPAITPDYRHPDTQEGNERHAGRAFSANALGRSIPGVFARYFLIPDADTTLAHIPEGVDIESALMCVDVVTTGFTGAEAADIITGDTVVVVGIGAIGLMAVQAAALMGAARIIAFGQRGACVEYARNHGASSVYSYRDIDIVARVMEETDGRGADAVILCGGDDETFARCIDMARYGIGRIVNLKLHAGDGSLQIPKFSSGRGMGGKTIKLELCKGGRRRIERLLDMVRYDRIHPSGLVTHKLHGFDKIPDALEMMRSKDDTLIKTMITMEWANI